MTNNGYYPSKDGRFRGRKIKCFLCGQEFRRYEMVFQRGGLVCKIHCADKPGHKPKGYTNMGMNSGYKDFSFGDLRTTYISIPFKNPIGTGGYSLTNTTNIVSSLGTLFIPQENDVITFSVPNNTTKVVDIISYEYLSGTWSITGTPANLSTNQVISFRFSNVNPQRPAFNGSLRIRGEVPTIAESVVTITQTDAGGDTYFTIPWEITNISSPRNLLSNILNAFPPVDEDMILWFICTIYFWDYSLQGLPSASGTYLDGEWVLSGNNSNILSRGDPMVISISKADRVAGETFTAVYPSGY